MSKLGLSMEQVGRITYALFSRLYQHYKNDFDIEMRLKASNTTYAELEERAMREEQWF